MNLLRLPQVKALPRSKAKIFQEWNSCVSADYQYSLSFLIFNDFFFLPYQVFFSNQSFLHSAIRTGTITRQRKFQHTGVNTLKFGILISFENSRVILFLLFYKPSLYEWQLPFAEILDFTNKICWFHVRQTSFHINNVEFQIQYRHKLKN